jgi:hypothetical protein
MQSPSGLRPLCVALGLLGMVIPAGAASTCPVGLRVKPDGQDGSDIQFAIQKARAGDVVLLQGIYEVSQTIRLVDQTLLCSEQGAVLKWVDQRVNGMMLDGFRAGSVTIRNIVFDGRGASLGGGGGHLIENNLFKNIPAVGDTSRTWPQRMGLHLVTPSLRVKVLNNHFQNIGDTGIMAYGLDKAEVSGNTFQDVNKGAHLWSSRDTLIERNSGKGFYEMALEVQGDHLPGVVIQDNTFSDWRASTPAGHYAVSVVAGKGTQVRRNTITALPTMGAALEVGGKGPIVSENTISNADLVIENAYDPVINGNIIQNAAILKDVNRVDGSTLTISGNRLINPPNAGIHTDYWYGYDVIRIERNQISKQLQNQKRYFLGISVTSNNRAPLQVVGNTIVIRGDNKDPTVEVSCIYNSGSKGNMRGTLIEGNSCESDGAAVFVATNSLGGHIGVVYRNNTLRNLKAGITGEAGGLVASGNKLFNVRVQPAGLDQN